MARPHSHRLFLAPLLLLVAISSAGASRPVASDNFIRSSCKSTRYPDLCEQCLSSYAATLRRTPRGVAEAALSVTLRHAQSACAFVNRLSASAKSVRSREAGAVRDCIENLGDSVDRIRKSIGEMGRMGKATSPGYLYHLSNIQTWVSAALTDENTCLDGFTGSDVDPAMRASVRKQIVGVAQVTSNALALVNRVALKH